MIKPFFREGEKQGDFMMLCDFCATPVSEDAQLIASPSGAHICKKCAEKCVKIFEEGE